jgi:hypothetical protein
VAFDFLVLARDVAGVFDCNFRLLGDDRVSACRAAERRSVGSA